MHGLRFRGWFQCRLATDPDPFDEPRGVSGYVHAYAGEPDLDRSIYFKKPVFERTYGPSIGVFIDEVVSDGRIESDSPLVGAAVDLIDQPKFEGRNGVIAEDGFEPISPFHLSISKANFHLSRAIVPKNPNYPFPEFFAGGVEIAPDVIRDATRIPDLQSVWLERLKRLEIDESTAKEPQLTAIRERRIFLEGSLTSGGGSARFFPALMRYSYELTSLPTVNDPERWLSKKPSNNVLWQVDFWLGGWDADVQCGYCRGSLGLPADGEAIEGLRSLRRP